MFCSQCGTANADSAQLCSKCGAALSTAQMSANPASVPPGAVQPPICPAQLSRKALTSLMFGLFFFVVPAAVVAIVFGHLSLSEIRKSAGRMTGHGMAMAGLILGYIGIAIVPFVLIVAAIAIPSLLRSRMAANQASAVGSLRTIISANMTYSSEFGNGFATTLDQLDGFGGTASCEHAMLIDHVLATGQRHGYVFTYSAKPSSDLPGKGCAESGASGFTVNADPVNRNTTGMRSYYTDETGVIRVETSGPASADSDELQ